DCLFVPDTAAMYPTEPLVRVSPGPMADALEGAARPGHFAGVLTVVAKLFHIIEPDVAVFGRKDFQQAMLVRRLAADLDFGLEVDVAPTVRELDGLALSSRNTYLQGDERRAAPTTWCSGRAWPVTSPCEPWREPPLLGRRHSGAPRARRACGGAPRDVGDGDAHPGTRARTLAHGRVVARRAARRPCGERARS